MYRICVFFYLIQYFISDSSCIWSQKKIFGVLKQQQMQCSSKIPAAEAAVLICNSELLQNVIIWWGSQPNSQASYHHIWINHLWTRDTFDIKMIFSMFIGGKHVYVWNRDRDQKCLHMVWVESKERSSTVSPPNPKPPICPTSWPSSTWGQEWVSKLFPISDEGQLGGPTPLLLDHTDWWTSRRIFHWLRF